MELREQESETEIMERLKKNSDNLKLMRQDLQKPKTKKNYKKNLQKK
jgi:hypothetical protein